MRQILLLFCVILLTITLQANHWQMDTLVAVDTLIVEDSVSSIDTLEVLLLTDVMENAVVHQDSLLEELVIRKRLGIVYGVQEKDGFRVQIYSSNQQQYAKNQALKLEQELSLLLEEPVYTISEPPFWKVRIGNFSTREQANEYRQYLISIRPDLQGSTYVVPDKIVIINK